MLQKMVTSFARVGGYIKPCLHLNEPCYVASSQNRLYANLKMTKTAGKKFQVIHVKLSVSDERRAKWMARVLFRCLRILTDVMRTFLISRGLMNSRTIRVQDSQGFLYAIKNRLNLPNFLNSNGHSKKKIRCIILNAIKGRNATCHTNLPEILSNWKPFLESWIELCCLMGANQKAGKIKRVLRSLKNNPRKIPVVLKSNVSAIAAFRKLEEDYQLTSLWTTVKEESYIYLGNTFFDLVLNEYSPALTKFAMSRRHQCPTSVIDCYELSKLIKTKCSATDFQKPHGATSFDFYHLKNAAEGRHAAIHEKKADLLLKWEHFLASMVYVCKAMQSKRAARAIAKIRSFLIRAKECAIRSLLIAGSNPLRNGPSGPHPPIRVILKATKAGRLKRLVKGPANRRN